MEFLVLPDTPAAAAHAGSAGAQTIPHASGRPWITGTWRPDEVTVLAAGPSRLAVFGRTSLPRDSAERLLAGARSGSDLDPLAARMPGAVHLAASIGGQVRVQGSLSTARQVFHTRIGGITVAASSAGTLSALAGAGPDPDALALRLLSPIAPWPLCLRPVWLGLHQLEVGHWLELGPGGEHRSVAWWTPPQPELPLAEAAPALRDALAAAVAARIPDRGALSADLSGGLDSTSLCFLAAQAGANLVTQHWIPRDEANDDTAWARRAAAMMPAAEHRFASPDSAPTWFDPESDNGGRRDPEGPLNWTRNRAHLEHQSRLRAADGSGTHLIGVGGDELFGLQSLYLWSLVRRQPLRTIPVVRRAQLVNRWSLGSAIRGLLDRSTFAESLRDMAAAIENPPAARPGQAPQGWGSSAKLPPWATPQATGSVARQLRELAAAGQQPLDPDRLQHQMLQSVIRSGVAVRQLNSALGHLGVSWEAPLLDDRVLELALSIRVEDRVQRGAYKPVLTTALRGTVPDAILGRRSKGEFSAEMYQGLQRNLRALLELTGDLRLAELGLADPDVLRAELLKPYPDPRHLKVFEATLAYENWLRSPDAAASASPLPAGDLA
jgi:asparagine synthase (glutamine-hydrolysing)